MHGHDPSCLGPHRVTQVNDNDTVKLVKVAENNDRASHETWIIWNVHQHRTWSSCVNHNNINSSRAATLASCSSTPSCECRHTHGDTIIMGANAVHMTCTVRDWLGTHSWDSHDVVHVFSLGRVGVGGNITHTEGGRSPLSLTRAAWLPRLCTQKTLLFSSRLFFGDLYDILKVINVVIMILCVTAPFTPVQERIAQKAFKRIAFSNCVNF